MIRSLLNAVAESVLPRPPSAAQLPVFPLGTVLFPGGLMSLKVFEQRYMDMAKACLKSGAPFGIALIRSGQEVGAPADPETVGTLARIVEWDMQDLGVLQLRVRGEGRFQVTGSTFTKNGLLIGDIEAIADDLHVDCPELPPCAAFLRKVLTQSASEHLATANFTDSTWVSFRITELLPFNNAIRQKMLELTDSRMRLEILHRFLGAQGLIG